MSDFTVSVLSNIGLFSFMALSAWVLLLTGAVSFGQQGHFAIGAYVGGIATAVWLLPLPLGLGVAVLAGTISGSLVALSTLRLGGVHFAVATLAFAEFVRAGLNLFTYRREVGGHVVGPAGAEGFGDIRWMFDAGWTPFGYMLLIWGLLCVLVALFGLMARAQGLSRLRRLGEDPLLAEMQGVNVARTRILAAALAGAIAALGGALYAHMATYVEPAMFSVMLGVHALAYGLIGGLGTAFGPILGVVIDIGVLESLKVFSAWRMILFGGLVVLVLILRPRGILDERLVRRMSAWRRR